MLLWLFVFINIIDVPVKEYFGRIWMLVDPCLEKKTGKTTNRQTNDIGVFNLFYLWFNLIYFCCKLNKKVIYC